MSKDISESMQDMYSLIDMATSSTVKLSELKTQALKELLKLSEDECGDIYYNTQYIIFDDLIRPIEFEAKVKNVITKKLLVDYPEFDYGIYIGDHRRCGIITTILYRQD